MSDLDEEPELDDQAPDELLFVWACGFELSIGLIGLLVAWVVHMDARAYLPSLEQLDWWATGWQVFIGAVASVPMLIVITLLMKLDHEPIQAIKRLSDDPTMKSLLSLSYPELLVLSLCAGIGEELAFRGCLLPWMTAIEDPNATIVNPYDVGDPFSDAIPIVLVSAVVFSSILFGLLHPITKLYVVVAAIMGVYFAVLMILTNSLIVPIVAHAAYDAAQFIIAKREMAAEEGAPEPT